MAEKETVANRQKKKIVITGNQGYIGSVLTEYLVKAGYRVVGIDSGIFESVQMVPRVPATVQIRKDIRDIEIDDLAGSTAVIHLAGLSNDPLGEMDKELTEAINFHAGVRLAEMTRSARVERFLFSSSCSIYGVSGQKLVREGDRLEPKTAYAKSKVRLEGELQRMSSQDFAPVMLRNATVFGFSPRLRLDLVVNDFTATGWLTGKIEVLSDGTPWRPNLHVVDCAQAFMFFLEADADKVRGEAFNIGRAENNLRVSAIAQQVRGEMPDSEVIIKGVNCVDERTYRVNFSKVEQLGWRGEKSVQQGARELLEVFKRRGFNAEEASFNGYYTLRRYQELMRAGIIDQALRLRDEARVRL